MAPHAVPVPPEAGVARMGLGLAVVVGGDETWVGAVELGPGVVAVDTVAVRGLASAVVLGAVVGVVGDELVVARAAGVLVDADVVRAATVLVVGALEVARVGGFVGAFVGAFVVGALVVAGAGT